MVLLQFIMRLNKFRLALGPSSKVRLLDECAAQSRIKIIQKLRVNPWIKLVGDNLDMFLRVGQQTSERQHKDLHYFTSVVMFSRLADVLPALNAEPRRLTYGEVQARPVLELQPVWKEVLFAGYRAVIGRILASNLPAFRWLSQAIPKHVPHR